MLVGILSNLLFTDRDVSFEAEQERQIRELTVQQVNKALKKHVKPKDLVIITAGDFSGKP